MTVTPPPGQPATTDGLPIVWRLVVDFANDVGQETRDRLVTLLADAVLDADPAAEVYAGRPSLRSPTDPCRPTAAPPAQMPGQQERSKVTVAEVTASNNPSQPTTPGEALRDLAYRMHYRAHDGDCPADCAAMAGFAAELNRWADELDAAPAAPPADLREEVAYMVFRAAEIMQNQPMRPTALEAADAILARTARATDPGPAAPTTYVGERRVLEAAVVAAQWYDEVPRGEEFDAAMEGLAEAVAEHEARRGPLSTVPPAGTEAE